MAILNVSTCTTRVAFLNKEKVLTKVERHPNIEWNELIEYASTNSGISKAMMSAAVYALENEIKQWIFNGHGIQLGNLGNLYISTAAKAKDSEEDAGAEAVYRVSVKFRQSSKLRGWLNNSVSLQTVSNRVTSQESETPNGNENNSGGGGNGGGTNENYPME